MRDLDLTDCELRLIAAIRRTAPEAGMPMPTIAMADDPLAERLHPQKGITAAENHCDAG